jgi:hypothetical protein
MNPHWVIRYLHPNSKPLSDWAITKIGPDEFAISEWYLADPQPEPEEIEATANTPEFQAYIAERQQPGFLAKDEVVKAIAEPRSTEARVLKAALPKLYRWFAHMEAKANEQTERLNAIVEILNDMQPTGLTPLDTLEVTNQQQSITELLQDVLEDR